MQCMGESSWGSPPFRTKSSIKSLWLPLLHYFPNISHALKRTLGFTAILSPNQSFSSQIHYEVNIETEDN